MTYIRSDDGAEMIEIAPHRTVNRVVLARQGWLNANHRDEVMDQAATPSLGHRGYTDET